MRFLSHTRPELFLSLSQASRCDRASEGERERENIGKRQVPYRTMGPFDRRETGPGDSKVLRLAVGARRHK